METSSTTINGVVISNKKKKLSGLVRDSSFKLIPSTDTGVSNKGKLSKNASLPLGTKKTSSKIPSSRFGHHELRASYNERIGRLSYFGASRLPETSLYKSNTSLDLETEIGKGTKVKEFGSHNSIDVASRSVSFEAPVASSTLIRPTSGKSSLLELTEENQEVVTDTTSSSSSPKSKKKGLFKSSGSQGQGQKSFFRKFRGGSLKDGNEDSVDKSADDRHRRRFFSHYDLNSICASLSAQSTLKTLERRNTTTGASAASAALRNGDFSESSPDADTGDNISNDLILSCPYFRNEVGGEGERSVALSRETAYKRSQNHPENLSGSHTPFLARGFSLLDNSRSYWKSGYCPFLKQVHVHVIERKDDGASFYKMFFAGKEHQNWFGMDDNLGAIAVSIRRESVKIPDSHKEFYLYRLIIRCSELLPLRGCVLEDSIPALKSEKIKTIPTKDVLEFVAPELSLSSLMLGVNSSSCEEDLIRLDEAYVHNKYKVGLMYCREGQQSEEEMYNNQDGGPAFNEFLDLIGTRVRLKGFNKYKAGLCNKNDSTGLYSVYTDHEGGHEIMFHVSTLLPFTANNRQQLPRKRYIGNDIVTVVFQEPGALPFIPNIKSQFQHVFIVVRVHDPCSENTSYSVAVTRSKSVPMFGPTIPPGARFPKSKNFANFLITKIINGENAAHHSDKFLSMAIRTRQELLKDLASNYITPTKLDNGAKLSLFTSSKKKDKFRPRFSPDTSPMTGALSWRVVVEDSPTRVEVDAFVGISSDSLVCIQDNNHHDILFVTSTKSILGWTALANSIRIYFHQGEALILHSKDWEHEDMNEISQRLKAVTNGAPTQEFTLRRNQLGQLGFHVQHDGLITEVENFGYAWQTGLRQGSRLVEICKHPVTSLSHENMVELLKTSMTVSVTVIPPHSDGSHRKGCHLTSCPGSSGSNSITNGDYENVSEIKSGTAQAPFNGKLRYEGSVSPPRSPHSSGYGTGSSRKSFNDPLKSDELNPGVVGISSNSEERWYDENGCSSPPPPLPTRTGLPSNIHHRYPRFQPEEKRCNDAKVTYLTEYELNQPSALKVHERLSALKSSSSQSSDKIILFSKSTDVSNGDKNNLPRSEDELSSSSSLSPQRRRRQNGSTTSSRNSSPKTIGLREEATKKKSLSRNHRNSANYGSSTLQEDLLKLIGPEFNTISSLEEEDETEIFPGRRILLSTARNPECSLMKSRSRENIASSLLLTPDPPSDFLDPSNEASLSFINNKCISSTQRQGVVSGGALPLALPNGGQDIDWSLLVDTASQVISDETEKRRSFSEVLSSSSLPGASSCNAGAAAAGTATAEPYESFSSLFSNGVRRESSAHLSEEQMSLLISKVNELESKLNSESRKKSSLETQVAKLRTENLRLQEESQTAAQQLRRFTEWFFQTIDKN